MKRLVPFTLATFAALLGRAQIRAQAPAITEFLLPTPSASPTGIASGSDGNLWITETAGNKIASISPDGVLIEYRLPTSSSQPAGIAAGPDGNLWFTELSGNNIGRITVSGVITEYALPTPSAAPAGITSGPDGNLWFVESAGNANKIGSITPAGAISEYAIQDLANPMSITAGPDGRLWFTEPTANKIGAITTAGAITEYSLIPAFNAQSGFRPEAIVAGPDGNLWFTAMNTIWSINTSGLAVQFTVPTPNFQPAGIVAGPDGNLWFPDQMGNDIGALSTSGVFAEYPIPSASSVPISIVVGSDGNLWFTEEGTNRVARLTLSGAPLVSGPFTVSPPSLAFTGYAGGPPPPTQTLTVTSSTPVVFTATSSVPISIGQPWLQISPSGNLTSNQTITVTVNQAQMGTYGNYVGNISLTSGTYTQIVPVTLTITPPPKTGNISVSPASLNFTYSTQGPAPTSKDLIVQDATQGVHFVPITTSYNVLSPSGGNWLTLRTGGGNVIPSGSPSTSGSGFSINVNPSELSPGTYTATFTVAATGGNTVTVPVALTVTKGPTTLTTTPTSLDFVWQVGSPRPAVQSFEVVQSGTIEPFQTEVNGGGIILDAASTGKGAVSVTINTSGLSAGTYVQPIFLTLLPFSIGESTSVDVILNAMDPHSNISGIVNAASLAAGALAPGELITIFGTSLGPSTPVNLVLDANGKVGTSLGGVSVSIDGHLAPLIYVSNTQINCVVPYELAGESKFFDIPVVLTYSGQQNRYTMVTGVAVPAIFTSDASGTGHGAIANASGGVNGPNNPASVGSTIIFYVTGQGQTIPAGNTGKVTGVNTSQGATLTPIPALPLRVMVGDLQAPVTFFGEAPDVVSGIMQINAEVPFGLPSGELPLVVSLGGISSQSGVTVSIK